MDLEALALAVDRRVRVPGADRRTARLYGVRREAGADLPDGVRLEPLAQGEARQIPQKVRPPAGLVAIAMAMTAWAAPMEEDGTMSARPSLHPERRRVHVTVLVAGDDGEVVSVLRYGDGEPVILRDGIGVVHDRLIRCWARRSRDTAPAGQPA